MRPRRVVRWIVVVLVSAVFVRSETGLQRVTPTNVRVPLLPGSATQYVVEREAFPGVTFENPVAIVTAPGEQNRLYVVERAGRIILIPDLNNPTREVFLDISERVNSDYTNTDRGAEGLNCVAFHPRHAENGYFYVVYTWPSPSGNMNRLSRFKSSQNRGDPSSEFVMIEQPDTGYGHNFNDVKFGPDGYLYVAVGDEGDGGGPGDEYGNSQRIDKDFFSAIMRIDVDLDRTRSVSANSHPSLKGGYKIPADNPYVNATQFNGVAVDASRSRTEFWAVGFRNPWRLFFDTDGTLYTGDVGRHDREEINIVRKGGNYGWAFKEGATTTSALGNPPGSVVLTAPVLEYPHDNGNYSGKCVIGGVVYRGSRLPELNGAYIFGDYMSGNIWSLRHNGSSSTEWKRIAGLFDVSAFGIDPRNGDVLVCKDKINDQGGDGIYRLDGKDAGPSQIPATLAGTGLFADVRSLTPASGFVPYTVNAPLWSDGADKMRWFGILNGGAKIGFYPDRNWTFPSGTIWIKHFELELEKGSPASRRRLETRVLVKNESIQGLYGVTYRWGSSLDDATLVPDEGASETLEIRYGNETRVQTWNYPARNDCLKCHTPSGGHALGFNCAQLNRDFRYPLSRTNQVIALRDAGYLDGPISEIHSMRRLVDLGETDWSRESRVRSYLSANCANCHNANGVERARWNANIHTPLPETGMINGELIDLFGSAENRVVKPGDPERSVLLTRMKQLGQGHMPPIGSSVVHDEAIEVIEGWIREDLANYKTYEQWINSFALDQRERAGDPDRDGASNYLEYLLGNNPQDPADGFRISISGGANRGTITFPQRANRGFEVSAANRVNGGWQSLDVPSNSPFFSATNRTGTVDFLIATNQNAFYRVRVYEP